MKWYQDYDFIFSLFDKGNPGVDETEFYFLSESSAEDYMIGFLPEYDAPYWAGTCDIPGGCEFKTARELFEAKIYGGRSIKDRWDELVIVNIGGIGVSYLDPSSF